MSNWWWGFVTGFMVAIPIVTVAAWLLPGCVMIGIEIWRERRHG